MAFFGYQPLALITRYCWLAWRKHWDGHWSCLFFLTIYLLTRSLRVEFATTCLLVTSVQRLRRCDKQWARLPRAWRGSDICSTVIPLSCIRTFPCVQYSPSSHSCVILEVHRTYGYYTLRINSDRMSCPLGKFLVKCHPSEGLKDGYPVSHLYLSLYYVVGRGAFLRPAPKAKPHSAKIKKKKKSIFYPYT